ncbi:unnamed protein product [Vitrella brassicaformis CCMP3155]|uniref:Integrase catalytic domain-containing protein n=1 Tax=Vitrella brassicaformis (strain CCMP3155) TaxID=1169540 RepID=A0A0G4GXE2_VITBC|nr:unnamed protein product [Vitrella brassicaformis CCMP3155]|eukprot:CEM35733.1 unnamed protein product [Vitrella brassicaformis CCMP3155]
MQHTSMLTQKDVRGFLGMTGYYHKFIPAYAHIAAPLTALTRKDLQYTYEEHWTDECTQAFEILKGLLCQAPVLAYPDFSKPFVLKTDASNVAVGAAMVQWDAEAEHERPIAFASRKLTANEPTYASQEQEALAVVWAIKYFRPYLYGRHFTIMTDHRSLQSLPKAHEKGNSRVHRWSVLLQHYTYTIVWKPGRENGDADALSRVRATHWNPLPRIRTPVTAHDMESSVLCALTDEPPSITLQTFRDEQRQDPVIAAHVACHTDGTLPDDKKLAADIQRTEFQFELIKGVLMHLPEKRRVPIPQLPRIVVPSSLRPLVFENCHDSPLAGHLGIAKTLDRISHRFWWPTMYRDVTTWVGCCKVCQAFRPARRQNGPLMHLPVHENAFDSISVDFAGPYPTTKQKNRYILVFVDQLTGWPEAVAVKKNDAVTVAHAFVDLIVVRHGCPRRLLCDRGSHFLNELVDAVCHIFRTRRIFSSAYHPETNGQAEKMVGTVKKTLGKYVASHEKDWDVLLPLVLFGIRSATNEAMGMSPFAALYGRKARLPLDVMVAWEQPLVLHVNDYRQELLRQMAKVRAICRDNREAERVKRMRRAPQSLPRQYSPGDVVWVIKGDPKGKKPAFRPTYTGPYRVIGPSRRSPLDYELRRAGEGAHRRRLVHISRIRPYRLLPDPKSEADMPLFRKPLQGDGGDGGGDDAPPPPPPPSAQPPAVAGPSGDRDECQSVDVVPPADVAEAESPAAPEAANSASPEGPRASDEVPVAPAPQNASEDLPPSQPDRPVTDAPSDPSVIPSSPVASNPPHSPPAEAPADDRQVNSPDRHDRPLSPPHDEPLTVDVVPPTHTHTQQPMHAPLPSVSYLPPSGESSYRSIRNDSPRSSPTPDGDSSLDSRAPRDDNSPAMPHTPHSYQSYRPSEDLPPRPAVIDILDRRTRGSVVEYRVTRRGCEPSWERESEVSDPDAVRAFETKMAFDLPMQRRQPHTRKDE